MLNYSNQYGTDRVAEGFRAISTRTAFTSTDRASFDAYRSRVEGSLGRSLSLSKCVVIGSYARGSAVRGVSDLDLLVVIRREDLVWGNSMVSSTTAMQWVRDALRNSYPNSAVGRDGQAVVLQFAGGSSLDVVPGWYAKPLENGWPLYKIPDGNGEWMPTAPDLHSFYINGGDERAGGKLKSVVRILKFWKDTRAPSLPLSAFHLELLLTQQGTCGPGRTLSACVADALSLLAARQCRALQDPCGVSGLIHAAGSEAKRDRLQAAVALSGVYARNACDAESRGSEKDALYYWNLVFNQRFA